MGDRYEYEAPGLIKYLLLNFKDWVFSEQTPRVWIYDKQTGKRFETDETEEIILSLLSEQLRRYEALSKPVRDALTDHTFDDIVGKFVARRAGDTVPYDELAEWDIDDWTNWCDKHLDAVGLDAAGSSLGERI